jgi:MFS family permease
MRGEYTVSTNANTQKDTSPTFAPLREKPFRRIWAASFLSSLGSLFFGVAVAWEMTRVSNTPTMVALVQTAMMLPLTIVTLPAGAISDMYDRRKIAMFGLGFTATSAAILAILGILGALTPWILLASCVLVGTGTALYAPSWQSSMPELVSRENLPAAVGLASLSANVARSFGPALAGFVILAAGTKTAFALTACFFIPLLMAFFLWDRKHVPSRLPPERIDRAIASGARYALHSPVIRTVLIRIIVLSLIISPGSALAPLVAKDLLDGNSLVLGILLGAQGVGAVMAALFVNYLRSKLETETAVRLLTLGSGLSLAAVGLSQSIAVTTAAFLVFGSCCITAVAILNVDVQLAAPRWVAARALSLFSSATTVGIGLGAWLWGMFASAHGVASVFVLTGLAAIASIGLGIFQPLKNPASKDQCEADIKASPAVSMDLTMRSGPIIVEIIYDVDPENAREFYAAVLQLQRVRLRIGGYNWSIARDVANPAVWTERYQCPTWGDYLRMLNRYSQADMELQARAVSFHRGQTHRTTRRLERPFGSVRWKPDSFDPQEEVVNYFGPMGTS